MLPDYRVRQRDYLLEITQAITQELDLDILLRRILDISVEMLAGQAGLFALRAERGGWSIATSNGISPALLRYLEPLIKVIPSYDEPIRYELNEVNRILQNLTRSVSWGLLTGVGLPLIVHQRLIGVIFIFRSYSSVFSANDQALLQSFADQAAIAVNNAQLYSQVIQEKQRMDALLDSTADGILIVSPDHKIERCNPAFARLVGLSATQIRGASHEEIIKWTKVVNGQTLEQAEMGGWPLTPHATLYIEGDIERIENTPLAVSITYAPLISEGGNLLNIIASIRDITRFREAEEIKSTFISVIGHELKTPIALIKGYVGTLRRKDATWDREVVDDSLAVIEEESDRLTELIENLLDASRLQAGALKINLAEVSMDLVAAHIVERFRTQTSLHTLVVDFPLNFPVILGDEIRLEQVLSNLISNAIKYAKSGGEIRVSGQVRPEHIIICVSDQGPGIPSQDLPYIFDRFYRSDEATRTSKGAGLGLYLARAVVEAHDGRIWADPNPETGARICFSLPRDVKI